MPDVYRSFFDRLPSRQIEPFPYTVLMPTFKGSYRRPEIERLALKVGKDIHVLEDSGAGLRATRYPIKSTHLVERGSILLHAWITVRGHDSTGAVHSTIPRSCKNG